MAVGKTGRVYERRRTYKGFSVVLSAKVAPELADELRQASIKNGWGETTSDVLRHVITLALANDAVKS